MARHKGFRTTIALVAIAVVVVAIVLTQCTKQQGPGTFLEDPASQVYVAPGEYDEFYAFMSGGFSGHVTVHGLPSGRLFKTIPVFSVFPENGYGFTEETKAMLNTSWGFIPWDDSHHATSCLEKVCLLASSVDSGAGK